MDAGSVTTARTVIRPPRPVQRLTSTCEPVPPTRCRFPPDIPDELIEPFEVKDAAMMIVNAMQEQATNMLAMLEALGSK